jgi:hypothetical protein
MEESLLGKRYFSNLQSAFLAGKLRNGRDFLSFVCLWELVLNLLAPEFYI